MYIPLTRKREPGLSPWAKPPLNLKQRRTALWRQYKFLRTQHGRNSDEATTVLQQYLLVNYEFRNYTIVKQCEYEANLGKNLKDNPKLFYSFIRKKKVGAPSIGHLRSLDGHVETDSHKMTEIFASAFSSVFTATIPEDPSPHQVFNEIIPQVDILLSDVSLVISKLDAFSSMGGSR